ncbi:MAG TPA: aromatic amino acid lyase [Solirubrobacteraceae bacterium]|jgi:histidine ammonia-lyase
MTVVIDGESLSLEQLVGVARSSEPVSISAAAIERMRQSRLKVERVLARDDAVYGMTTGLGQHKRHRVAAADVPEFNRRLLDNHLIAQGPPVPDEVVRATMLRLANGFAKGTVGVRPVLAQRLVDALNTGEHPPVRLLGSAGEADLGPLADLARGLFADLELQAKEGLALVNNNSFSTALAALAVVDVGTLIDSITVAGALDLEAFRANLTILDPVVGESRPYPGLQTELAGLRRALQGSSLWGRGAARNLQDPLSYRSIVQLGGVARDALAFVRGQLAIELNAHHDNPIVTPVGDRIISAGNYEALPVAVGLDFLRIALAPLLTASLERAMKLLQTPLSGLPGGLSENEGLEYGGLGAISWSAHALTAEARLLAQPVSFELATTTPEEGIGDRITMAPLAARRLAEQTALGHRIVAIELLCSSQALDLRAPERLGALTGRAYDRVRELIPFAGSRMPYPADLEPLSALVRSGSVAAP